MQPFLAKGLCLLLDQLHGGLLLIWWGLVLAQDQRDHRPQLGPQALALGPVQKQVLAQIAVNRSPIEKRFDIPCRGKLSCSRVDVRLGARIIKPLSGGRNDTEAQNKSNA